MNMFKEFFNYFLSVIMGKRDSLTAFLEPLTMGERYLHWGSETQDLRDYRAALDHLHLCQDRDAPMASLLIRKYNCISGVTGAAIESLLRKHNKVIDNAIKTENSYREEMDSLIKKVAEGKDFVRKLQEEGSLIKAKSEESRIQELEGNIDHLRTMLESGESKTEVYDSYDEMFTDAQRFLRELDHASTVVMATNITLGQNGAEMLSNQLRSKLDYLHDLIEKANPLDHAKKPEAKPKGGQR